MTGTAINASVPRPLGKTEPVFAFEVAGLTLPVLGGLRLAALVGLAGKLELEGCAGVRFVSEVEFSELELKAGVDAVWFGLTVLGAVSGLVRLTVGFGIVAGTGFDGLLEFG
jgi:hypothetical protein